MPQKPVSRRAWAIVGCAWFMGFAMFSRILSLPPIGNVVKEALSVPHSKIGLLFSLPVAILAATAIPSGVLGDRIGPRKAVGIGAIFMALSSFASGTSTTFSTLFFFTCIFGIGFSLTFTNLPKLIGVWFPPEKVGMAIGIYVTGITIGVAIALGITLPAVFPITKSFQGTFFIWSIPLGVAALLWWLVVKDPPPSSTANQNTEKNIITRPLFYIWKNPYVWFLALALFFQNIHYYTWNGWTPQLMIMKGAPPKIASLMISLMSWISIPCAFLIPWASHKVGLVKPFILGMALGLAISACAAIYIPSPLGWPLMIFLGFLFGTYPLLLALPIDLVPVEFGGTAVGMVLSVGYLGAFIGPWFAGYTLDKYGTLNPAFIFLIGAGIAFFIFAALLPETGPRVRVVDLKGDS